MKKVLLCLFVSLTMLMNAQGMFDGPGMFESGGGSTQNHNVTVTHRSSMDPALQIRIEADRQNHELKLARLAAGLNEDGSVRQSSVPVQSAPIQETVKQPVKKVAPKVFLFYALGHIYDIKNGEISETYLNDTVVIGLKYTSGLVAIKSPHVQRWTKVTFSSRESHENINMDYYNTEEAGVVIGLEYSILDNIPINFLLFGRDKFYVYSVYNWEEIVN